MTRDADALTVQEIKARLAIAVAEVGLYSRLASELGVPVTLDLVRRATDRIPKGYDIVIWSDES